MPDSADSRDSSRDSSQLVQSWPLLSIGVEYLGIFRNICLNKKKKKGKEETKMKQRHCQKLDSRSQSLTLDKFLRSFERSERVCTKLLVCRLIDRSIISELFLDHKNDK